MVCWGAKQVPTCKPDGERSPLHTRHKRTMFLCRLIPGSQLVIMAVLLSTGRPSMVRTRSICGTKML